ncbi:MAG TPA: hypothetical protein VMI75_07570 [Polyangiaceae bacterium]|nr:hypothetical protein [Polyangiaceae bacterium]
MRSVLNLPYRPRQRLDASVVAMRERLARLGPGGSAALPLDVESASQIEVRAESTPCLVCQGPYRVDEHTAERIDGQHVRVVCVHCHHCGARRVIYFRVC